MKNTLTGLIVLCGVMALMEGLWQRQDTRFVRSKAESIIAEAHASEPRAKVLALRDYLRTHVSWQGLPGNGRAFLRDSAATTLRLGRGYCGETSRAFICMATAVGIPAQRINLEGSISHVVAEAELAPGDRVIVDSHNPPAIADLMPLDSVINRPEYVDYSTVNLRRFHVNWLVKVQNGPVTLWLEQPHAIKVVAWLLLGLLLLSAKAVLILRAPAKEALDELPQRIRNEEGQGRR